MLRANKSHWEAVWQCWGATERISQHFPFIFLSLIIITSTSRHTLTQAPKMMADTGGKSKHNPFVQILYAGFFHFGSQSWLILEKRQWRYLAFYSFSCPVSPSLPLPLFCAAMTTMLISAFLSPSPLSLHMHVCVCVSLFSYS